MKILVPVKRVVDANFAIHAQADASGADLAHAHFVLNPFDEVALEAALRYKEHAQAGSMNMEVEVIAVSAGTLNAQENLRQALALGADRAILIYTDAVLQPLAVAKLLQAICAIEAPQLVLCGKQAIDDDAQQTPQMLAALLDWPQAIGAALLEIEYVEPRGAACYARVSCVTDDGQDTLELRLPAVISADLCLNTPRYTSLINIMQAKKKPLKLITPAELGVDVAPCLRTLRVFEPPKRACGVQVANIAELVSQLKLAKVLA